MNTSRRLGQLAVAAIFTTTMSGIAFADIRTIEEHFSVAEGGTLYLRTDSGSIEIETHSEPTVHLMVDIDGNRADEFELSHSQNGNDLNIIGELERGSSWGWNNGLRVEFTLTIPNNFNVDLNTSGGSISVEDLQGDIEADTSGGSINIGSVVGNVDISTSGGSIHTDEVSGNINAHTSGGSVHVEFTQQITEDAKLSTSGGSITAILPQDIELDIDATTSGGRVKSDFDIDGRVKKQSIRGSINGGGPSLKLNTSGGNIRVKSR